MTEGWNRVTVTRGQDVASNQPVELAAQVVTTDDGSPVLYVTVKHVRENIAAVLRFRDPAEVAKLADMFLTEVGHFQTLTLRHNEKENGQ